MRAMVLDRQGDIDTAPLRMMDVPDPQPGRGEVRVKVSVCAVCRTDLHVVEGDLGAVKLRLIPGHQVVGVIDQVGQGCERFEMGQRIGIAWLRQTDGTCEFCRRGRENLCAASQYTGYHADGGYAELAVVPEDFAYALPEGYDDASASPLLCAGIIGYRALQRAAVREKGRLLLIGFGSSAHIVHQIGLHRGLEVYVVTRGGDHRQFAMKMGATWAGASCEDVPERMDSAILFAPVGELVPPALATLKPGGILCIAGIHLTDVPSMNYQQHLFHEREIRSVEANTRADGRNLLREAAEAGVKPTIHMYPMSEANRALADLKHNRFNGTAVLHW